MVLLHKKLGKLKGGKRMKSNFLSILFGCMVFLSILMFLCLYNALKGPRYTDRMICINIIATLSVSFICILSVYLKESFLVDIALVYSMLSFLAVIVLCRIVTLYHQGWLLYKERREEKGHD